MQYLQAHPRKWSTKCLPTRRKGSEHLPGFCASLLWHNYLCWCWNIFEPGLTTSKNERFFFLSTDVVMHQTVLTVVDQHLSWMHCVQGTLRLQRPLSRNTRYKRQRAIWSIVTIRPLNSRVVMAIGILKCIAVSILITVRQKRNWQRLNIFNFGCNHQPWQ